MTFLAKFSKQITNSSKDFKRVVSLLDWQVNSEICTLRNLKSGAEVRINPRGMEVLAYLIEHPGKVISTNEFLDLFWSKSVRSDHAVHNVIAELRSALGDKAATPNFIKTYPKRGYALIAKPVISNINEEDETLAENIANDHSFFTIGALKVSAFSLLFGAAVFTFFISTKILEEPNTEPNVQRNLLVQPFETINLAPNATYLSQQLPGSLVSRLSKLPNAQVVVNQGNFNDEEIVDYLLNGSIQQVSGEHRVQVNLSDAKSSAILFSDQFTFTSEEIFNIQDDIVQHVAIALRIFLDDDLHNDMLDWGTSSALAYDAFLKAEFYANSSNHASFRESIANYQFAIEQDPDFSNAYLGLATVATKTALYSLPETSAKMRKLVNSALQELLRIDPNSLNAKATQILALRVDGKNQDLIESNVRSLILEGNPPDFALSHYSLLLTGAKLYREAQDFLSYVPDERPFKVSPDATWSYRNNIDRPRDLISLKKQQLLEKPTHIGILGSLSRSYAFLGDYEQAVEYLARQLELDEEGPSSMLSQIIISALYGSSSPEGDAFEARNRDNPDFNFSLGAKAFILGDIDKGIEKWSNLNAADTRRLFSWISFVNIFFPNEVLANERYEAMLDELGTGINWQRRLMEGVSEMSLITGIELSEESKLAYIADKRLIRNNLWDHSEICYSCLHNTAAYSSPMEGGEYSPHPSF